MQRAVKIMLVLIVLNILFNVFFVFGVVSMTYTLENQEKILAENIEGYHKAEESYISKLEAIRSEGVLSAGLVESKNPVFVNRFSSFAVDK